MMVYNIEFYAYLPKRLKYKYIFLFISISGRIQNIFPAEPDLDPYPLKKMSDPHPWLMVLGSYSTYAETETPTPYNANQNLTVVNGLKPLAPS